MKQTRFLFAAVVALGMGGCASDPSSPPPGSSSSGPYVVDSYPQRHSRCTDCGTVESVNERQIAGKPNVVGAVVGAIIGGVVGHQFGSGRGNTAATAGGAVVGGVVGSQVQKGERTTIYDMNIRMDNGEYRTVPVAATGDIRSGSRVRISGDHVTPI
jgi:outer membrane lipoprotein SlyB